tara:strand:+ start:108 stop:749 length:642 start_codon:yes stop_codon:yes gene_type:complete
MLSKKYYLFAIIFFITPLLTSQSQSKPSDFKTFISESNNMSISYPDSWYVKEYFRSWGLYVMLFSQEEVRNSGDTYKVGVSFVKRPLISSEAPLGVTIDENNPDITCENIHQSVVETWPYDDIVLLSKKKITIDEVPATLNIFSVKGSAYMHQFYKRILYSGFFIKDDMLFSIMCEAPFDQRKIYEPIFNTIINNARLSNDSLQEKEKDTASP